MKKFVVVAAAIAAFGFVGSASAADMPVKGPVYKAPMYAPTPVYNWTGFYIGLNGGVGIGRTTGDLFPVNGDGNFDLSGGLFGAQIGYNHQFNNIVVGVEADYDWADINGSTTVAGATQTAKVKSLGSLRGRLGVAWDRALLYATAGWAWGSGEGSFSPTPTVTDSHTHYGYAVGAGLEYGITQNLSAKAEYLYTSLTPTDYFKSAGCPASCGAGANVSTFRIGANWRFMP